MTASARRTKIVATVGPACDAPGVLERVLAAGVDVVRLSAAHAGLPELQQRLSAVRVLAQGLHRVVGVMLDLPGPKVRVGDVAPGTVLADGSTLRLLAGECVGDSARVCVTHACIGTDVASGDRVLIDDGRLELEVVSAAEGEVVCRVMRGGPLSSHKGLNVPGVRLSLESVTPADLEALAWGIGAGVDLFAQSFVRSAGDVATLRRAIGGAAVPVVAKIEKHEALEDLGAIVSAADAVMVARGDLAVETAPERVPPAQRAIIDACRALGKPVIVATQMLESMMLSPRPTRAEASDIATAVFEGADAVMLAEETAVGAYPVESVETMDRICRAAEDAGPVVGVSRAASGATSSVASAACDLAADVGASALVVATQSGATARAVARCRPPVPVLALTPLDAVARALALVWGVTPWIVGSLQTIDEMTAAALDAARSSGAAHAGEKVVLTAGTTVGVTGSTDLIRVLSA